METTALITELVDRSGKSKSAICKESGLSRSLLDGYLKGKNNPTLGQLQRLARAAGYEIDLTLRPKPKPLPEALIHVLEFGEMFPRKEPAPLVNLAPIWKQVRTHG